MAVYLTNGKYYIAHSNTGAVTKVSTIQEAQNFYTVERAIKQKEKASKKCSGYYYIKTEMKKDSTTAANGSKIKRKKFSASDRIKIYRKTKGHCYLCGDFIDFDMFEIEHKIPLAKGGTNEINNLFCACHTCNTLKGSIAPADLMEKIKQIHLYQIKKKNGSSLKWRMIYKILEEML